MDLVKLGAGAFAGGFGARAIPQAVAASYNTGWTGYLLNLLATLGLGWAANKFVGRDAALGVMAGGLAATGQRIWDEQVSGMLPTAAAATGTSGLGDASYSSTGLGWYSPFDDSQGRGGAYRVNAPVAAVAAANGKKASTGVTAQTIQMPARGRQRGGY